MLLDVLRLVVTWVVYLATLAAALYVVTWPVLWLMARRRGTNACAGGWRPWAAWIVLVALIAVAVPRLGADVERRARVAKARGDVLLLGKAVAAYAVHCGGPPAADAAGADCRTAAGVSRGPLPRALLKPQRNARGVEAGPFVESVPRLPPHWTGAAGTYAYVVDADGRARVCGAGDGVVADSATPGRATRGPC